MKAKPLPPTIKWHGGKYYLRHWIISHMPKNILHYVETCVGGGSVLLAREPTGSEVVNDKLGSLTNFWRVLRDPEAFTELKRYLEATPVSKVEFGLHRDISNIEPPDVDVTAAAAFFICCRQSMSGRMRSFTPLTRNRLRRGINAEASAWWTAVEGLDHVHRRLKNVVVMQEDVVELVEQQDGKNTFFYLDPPYLHSTRTASKVYAHEMSAKQHATLLDTLSSLQGKFLLSGYRSELYDEYAKQNKWKRFEYEQPNHSAKTSGEGSKRVMTECLWCNY